MISKIHHCMVDGVSSVDLLNVLLQPAPSLEIKEAPSWIPRPGPNPLDLAGEALGRLLRLPSELGRGVQDAIRDAQDPRSDLRARLRALRDTFGTGIRTVSATPLNRPVGPHRRFDWHAMDLAEVKAVKNALGGSINDVVLATVNGAVRRFLERHRVNVETLDFRVMAPVSVRSADARGTLGNRVSAWMVPLPLDDRDASSVMAKIRETTSELKESKSALGAEALSQVGEWTPSTLLSIGSRMMLRALPFNLVVTNVPGPQVPLYLLDAKMVEVYPVLPLLDRQTMTLGVMRYTGKLYWGTVYTPEYLEAFPLFIPRLQASLAELLAEVEAETPATAEDAPAAFMTEPA
jgi:WS/DGAT/MGAT family acyltransferase